MIEQFAPYIGRFFFAMNQMRAVYDELLDGAAVACGLTRQEADILIFLSNNPNLNTAREISRYRGFSKAYVSKAVEPLVEKGYLAVRVDAQDRRRIRLLLGETAEKPVLALHKAQREFAQIVSRDIPQAEIEALINLVERFGENAAKGIRED